jgi:Transposase DDE domain
MTTIPQVARAMREILTTVADAAARSTRFVLRRSPLGGATFSQALVFGFLSHPQASLEELSQTAAALGVDITPQALDQRFTEAAAACLKEVLHAALARVVAAHPVAIPLLARFTAVALQDSSTIVLPDILAPVWQGCGGNTAERTKAALKLQVRLEMQTGRLDVQLQDGRAADQAAEFPGTLAAGALHLADLGYWSLDAFRALTHQGVFWLSRLQVQTAIYTATGQRHDLLALLTAQPAVPLDMAVALGETQHLPARLLAVRVPQEVAANRRRRLREAARKKGRQASTTRLALAAWTLLVTNVPRDRLTLREALVLARVRWQIELLFKLWKSHGRIDESRSTKPWRILCEVYAKLLAMLVQHWVFLVSCWAYPNRSLVKAAQTVQKHALHLASTFGRLRRLITTLSTVQRCVAAGCRMNRRTKHPNTYQLLLNDMSMTTALA